MNKKKIRRYLQELRYIVPTLYFNFHYLPFRQAIRLPIVLYKPHLLKCKGTIRLEPEDGRIRHGMIRLGFHQVSLYPNNGFTWENMGGNSCFYWSISATSCLQLYLATALPLRSHGIPMAGCNGTQIYKV